MFEEIDNIEKTEVKRKPRRKGLAKLVRRWGPKLFGYALPLARYTIIPGMVLYSYYFTEPQASITSYFNPLL